MKTVEIICVIIGAIFCICVLVIIIDKYLEILKNENNLRENVFTFEQNYKNAELQNEIKSTDSTPIFSKLENRNYYSIGSDDSI